MELFETKRRCFGCWARENFASNSKLPIGIMEKKLSKYLLYPKIRQSA